MFTVRNMIKNLARTVYNCVNIHSYSTRLTLVGIELTLSSLRTAVHVFEHCYSKKYRPRCYLWSLLHDMYIPSLLATGGCENTLAMMLLNICI